MINHHIPLVTVLVLSVVGCRYVDPGKDYKATTSSEETARTQCNLTRAPVVKNSFDVRGADVARYRPAWNTDSGRTAGRRASPVVSAGEAVTYSRLTIAARAVSRSSEAEGTATGLARWSERPIKRGPGCEVCMSSERFASKNTLRPEDRWFQKTFIPGYWWYVQKNGG